MLSPCGLLIMVCTNIQILLPSRLIIFFFTELKQHDFISGIGLQDQVDTHLIGPFVQVMYLNNVPKRYMIINCMLHYLNYKWFYGKTGNVG